MKHTRIIDTHHGRALFEQIDRPALKPLPATRYELAEWKVCRVNIDHQVEVDHNFYSAAPSKARTW